MSDGLGRAVYLSASTVTFLESLLLPAWVWWLSQCRYEQLPMSVYEPPCCVRLNRTAETPLLSRHERRTFELHMLACGLYD